MSLARDVLFICFVSLVGVLGSFLSSSFLGFQMSYIVSLFLFVLLLSFSFHFIPRFGSAVLFSVLFSLLSLGFSDFGIVGVDRFLVFVGFAFVFEGVFFLFKMFSKKVFLSILIASFVSAAVFPLLIGVVLSVDVLSNLARYVLNLVLLSFFVGVVASLVSLLVWYYLRTFKFFLKFQCF